jgi:DNA-directed RNA polymerase subunit omega
MALSLKELVNFDENMYEVTNAIIKRSKQIAEIGDEDLERYNNKIVSTAISQVFTKKIEYHYKD